MATVTVKEAKLRLEELLQGLNPGEDIVVTEKNRPIARIVSVENKPIHSGARRLGFLPGSVKQLADDFDAPMDDLREYMQ